MTSGVAPIEAHGFSRSRTRLLVFSQELAPVEPPSNTGGAKGTLRSPHPGLRGGVSRIGSPQRPHRPSQPAQAHHTYSIQPREGVCRPGCRCLALQVGSGHVCGASDGPLWVVWEAKITQKSEKVRECRRTTPSSTGADTYESLGYPADTHSDWGSFCGIFGIFRTFGRFWPPRPPTWAHLRHRKRSQSGPGGPNIDNPAAGRPPPWAVWGRYGALGPAMTACVGAGCSLCETLLLEGLGGAI